MPVNADDNQRLLAVVQYLSARAAAKDAARRGLPSGSAEGLALDAEYNGLQTAMWGLLKGMQVADALDNGLAYTPPEPWDELMPAGQPELVSWAAGCELACDPGPHPDAPTHVDATGEGVE